MRIMAFVTEAAPVQRILAKVGEPTAPFPIAPARGPAVWGDDPEPMPDGELVAQPDPGFAFDERISRQPPASAIDGAAAQCLGVTTPRPRPADPRSRSFREARPQPRLSLDRPSGPSFTSYLRPPWTRRAAWISLVFPILSLLTLFPPGRGHGIGHAVSDDSRIWIRGVTSIITSSTDR